MDTLKNIILTGDLVLVISIEPSNIEKYLSIWKESSMFARAYEVRPEFWEEIKATKVNEISQGQRDGKDFLIENIDKVVVGYMAIENDIVEKPEIEIGIAKEFRRNGYAYEAARLLIEHILSDDTVSCICWKTFTSNRASCRIAEKLGATPQKDNLIETKMIEAGYSKESLDKLEMPQTYVYEISRENFISGRQ